MNSIARGWGDGSKCCRNPEKTETAFQSNDILRYTGNFLEVIIIRQYNATVAALQKFVKLAHADFPMFLDSTFRVIGSFSTIRNQNSPQMHSQGRAMHARNISEAHSERLRTPKVRVNPVLRFLN